jgi:hypothetical protein
MPRAVPSACGMRGTPGTAGRSKHMVRPRNLRPARRPVEVIDRVGPGGPSRTRRSRAPGHPSRAVPDDLLACRARSALPHRASRAAAGGSPNVWPGRPAERGDPPARGQAPDSQPFWQGRRSTAACRLPPTVPAITAATRVPPSPPVGVLDFPRLARSTAAAAIHQANPSRRTGRAQWERTAVEGWSRSEDLPSSLGTKSSDRPRSDQGE